MTQSDATGPAAVFLNGRIVPDGEARLDPADRGFLLGDGIFETLRAGARGVEDLAAHLARLRGGAELLGLPVPAALDAAAAMTAVLEACGLTGKPASLRLTLARGPGPRGLLPPETPAPTVLITAQPRNTAPLPAARAVIARVRRNEGSPLSRIKSLSYLDNVLARREAAARGADEAILLNTAGRLACASAANLFLVRDGTLLTPPVSEGVLAGIVRARILAVAGDLGMTAVEAVVGPDELRDAEEAFVSNSLVGLRPIAEIDGQAIGSPAGGPVTASLAATLFPAE